MTISMYGAYGTNLGDNAILMSIIPTIEVEFKFDIQFNVFTRFPSEARKTFPRENVNYVDIMSATETILTLSKSDIFIYGGGGLIGGEHNLKLNLNSLEYILIVIAKLFRKPVILYAVGVDAFDTHLSKYITRWILNSVDLIILRDKVSYNLLKEIDINKPIMCHTADAAVLLTPDPEVGKKIIDTEMIETADGEILIGMSVKNKGVNIDCVVELCDELITVMNAKIVLVPFNNHKFRDDEDDLRIALDIRERTVQKQSVYVVKRSYTPIEIISLFSHFDVVVGMRLHSLIFSFIANVPFFGISYADKVANFCSSIGLERYCLSLSDYDNSAIIRGVKDLLAKKSEIKADLEGKLNYARALSLENPKTLRQYLHM